MGYTLTITNYKYTFTFPIKARLLGGEYYATEAALRNSIASFLAKKSDEGVYVTEYELAGSEFVYNMACEPLYASMLYDTGDNVTLKEFINAMGPQWEIEFANIPSEINIRELIHNLLDLAGMIPVIGAVFDGINAGIYFIEGDVLNGSISLLGTIEFWGGCYALRIALKNGDSVSKIAAKKLSEYISRVKSGVGNVLTDIASIERIGNNYEFVTADGIIFKMSDDDILYSTKSVIKAMANSTDELITCLKTKPEALFELVKETKKLDDGILFKLVDDTEVKIFKSDLTADMHPALVGKNGLLVTGDCTEEMMGAGREAIEKYRLKGIKDSAKLSEIGSRTADAVGDALKRGITNPAELDMIGSAAGASVENELRRGITDPATLSNIVTKATNMAERIFNKFTVEEMNNLKKYVIAQGQALQSTGITTNDLGPAVAGVYNKRLKKITPIKINALTEEYPKGVQLIEDRIKNMPEDIRLSYLQTRGPGSHAEVYAMAEAMLEDPLATADDLLVYVNYVKGSQTPITELPFHTCPHCEYILDGFNILSDIL